MSYDVIWTPVPPVGDLAKLFADDPEAELPHFVDDPNRRTASGAVSATLDGKTLYLGVLVTSGDPPLHADTIASPEQFRAILKMAAAWMRVRSEDVLCAIAAHQLHERHGPELALKALRRAVELIPESTASRGDLIVSLFSRATNGGGTPSEDLDEAARAFLTWQALDTSESRNAESVIYAGLAALAFLGRTSELGTVITSHRDFLNRSPWLQQQLNRLYSARVGCVVDIASGISGDVRRAESKTVWQWVAAPPG